MKFFIYNEVIFQLTLKIYNSEHLVTILSRRHQSMKRNSNQRLKRCLKVMFSTIISIGWECLIQNFVCKPFSHCI